MNLIKPNRLLKGDTISIIAPSGYVDFNEINNAKNYFESQGYNVKLGENIFEKYRYMAGNDNARLSDLHNAFEDKEVNAIICARGGYGSIRLLNKIDYNIIRNNPKIFCGYSDITALSALILKRTGLITYSGPMAKSDFQANELCEFTINNFWETLTNDRIKLYPKTEMFTTSNSAAGILFGGNLATIASLCGIDFIPDDDFIFFAEDLNEPVYKIDKYFTQLLNIYQFRKSVKAIILGDFLETDNNIYLKDMFEEISYEFKIPVSGTYPISHTKEKATIPIGGYAILNNGILTVQY